MIHNQYTFKYVYIKLLRVSISQRLSQQTAVDCWRSWQTQHFTLLSTLLCFPLAYLVLVLVFSFFFRI